MSLEQKRLLHRAQTKLASGTISFVEYHIALYAVYDK